MPELRQFERHPVPPTGGRACLDQEGRKFNLADISLGGVGFLSNHSYDVNTQVKIRVENSVQFDIRVLRCEQIDNHWVFKIGGTYAEHTVRPGTLTRILSQRLY